MPLPPLAAGRETQTLLRNQALQPHQACSMQQVIEGKIWVFVEQRRGQIAEVGLELLGKARELAGQTGWKVAAVLVGHGMRTLAERVSAYPADEVIVADDPLLAEYCNQSYVKALEPAIREFRPEVFLIAATYMGTDLAPKLAARLRTGLSAHCIDLHLTEDGQLLSVVPGWGGNVLARISCPRTRPQFATVMPGIFAVPEPSGSTARIIDLHPRLAASDVTYTIVEMRKEESTGSGLETAEVVIAGGWGVGSKADWKHVEELASLLGGAVGATRPPVDEGWAREKQMIGQSGVTVRPRLYIGIGISGHMHHLVGLRKPDLMVAVNSDPSAAIFDHCDLALVGDYREVVPALIKAIKAYSGGATG